MAMSYLDGIRVGKKHIQQSINTSTDSVCFTVGDKTLLTIDCTGYVTKTDQEKYIGKFSILKNVWVFCFFNDNFVSVNECDKIETNKLSLIDAEMLVVQELIKRNLLEV